MPVAAAYMVYAGATMATTTMFGAIMAGAMVVGGAYSLVGTLTGNEYMEKDGMILGSLASLGSLAAGSGAAAGTESTASADLTATGVTPGAPSTVTGDAVSTGIGGGTTAGTSANVAGGMNTAQYMELSNRFNSLQAANESAQTMNLIGNVGQGAAQAYGSYQQRKSQEEIFNQERADKLAEEERQRQNMNLTGLTIETPTMPSILPKPKPPAGLINQPGQAYNPVTGSGMTTMQLQSNRAR